MQIIFWRFFRLRNFDKTFLNFIFNLMNTPTEQPTTALETLCAPEWQQIAEEYLSGKPNQQTNQLKQLLADSAIASKAEFEDFNTACSGSFSSDQNENEALLQRCHDHQHVWKYTLHLLILLRDNFEQFCIERRLECGSLDLEGQAKPFIKTAELNYWQNRLGVFKELGSAIEKKISDLTNTDAEDLRILSESIKQIIAELEVLDHNKIQRRNFAYELAENMRAIIRVFGG